MVKRRRERDYGSEVRIYGLETRSGGGRLGRSRMVPDVTGLLLEKNTFAPS
jgi:hypothetical protein